MTGRRIGERGGVVCSDVGDTGKFPRLISGDAGDAGALYTLGGLADS